MPDLPQSSSLTCNARLALWAMALCLVLSPAHAQNFVRFGEGHGLISDEVYTSYRDERGGLWIGSREGLQLWQGTDLSPGDAWTSTSSGLPGDWVVSLAAASDSLILVGTQGGGLASMNPETGRIRPIPISSDCDAGSHSPLTNVKSIVPLRDGSFWLGTTTSEPWRYDPGTGLCPYRFANSTHARPRQLLAMVADGPNGGWVGSLREGVYQVRLKDFQIEVVDSLTLPTGNIRDMVREPSGTLWIATSGAGVWRYDPSTGELDRLRHMTDAQNRLHDNKAFALDLDHPHLWIGTFDGGLSRYHIRNRTMETFRHDPNDPGSLCHDVVNDIYADTFGMIWVATDGGLCGLPKNFPQELPVPSQGGVTSVSADRENGGIWIGGERGIASVQGDVHSARVTEFIPLAPSLSGRGSIRDIVLVDSIPIAGSQRWGFLRVDGQGLSPAQIDGISSDPLAIRDLLLHAGALYASTLVSGIKEIDLSTMALRRVVRVPLSTRASNALAVDAEGTIWAASIPVGVRSIQFDGSTPELASAWTDPQRDRSIDDVRDLVFASDNRLWVATAGGVLAMDPVTRESRVYSMSDGLPSTRIIGIDADLGTGRVWALTDDAVSFVEPEEDVWHTLRPLSRTRGEQFIERGLAVADSGIFAATDATLWFYDSRVDPPGSPLPSTEFSSGGATILAVDSVVILPRGEVEFEVTSMLADLYRPNKIRSRFSLSGVGSDAARQGAISSHAFSDLTPRGQPYSLTVTTVASTGQIFRRNFAVHVRSWIWEATWFRVATALSVIAGFVGGYAARTRRRRREAVEIRTALAQGREDERKALSRHIHDDPLQALYAVRHRLELHDPGVHSGQPQLDEVVDMAGRAIDSLRRICANLRPETIGHVNLDRSLASKCAEFQSDHPELDVEADLCETGEHPEELVVALFRILQSALANVARHAQASSVVVSLESRHSHLVLKISDDGAGFVNDTSMLALARADHFGLLGMHEWANQVGGELSIVSRPGSGTAVTVTVRTRTL